MQRCTITFEVATSPLALRRAIERAARGKRRRSHVALALLRRDDLAVRLSCTPKPRAIACPSFEDRVVHTALVDAIEPTLRRSARAESWACRPRGGTHRAALTLARYQQRACYRVHLDLRSYFPSIDARRVEALLRPRVQDQRLADLVLQIVDSNAGIYDPPVVRAAIGLAPDWPPPGRGLVLGSSVSRMIANHLMLDALDHHVCRTLRPTGYVRYVDDLFVFGRSRGDVRAARDEIVRWPHEERDLRVHDARAPIRSCRQPLVALGHVITRQGVQPRPRILRRLKMRLRELVVLRRRGWRKRAARCVASSAGLWMFGLPGR